MEISKLFFILLLVSYLRVTRAENQTNYTQNLLEVYFRKVNEGGPRAWLAGTKCLYNFAELYFERREQLTRSLNIVATQVFNLSMPAAFIQRGYLQRLNDINSPRRNYYQVRVMSDATQYDDDIVNDKGVVLADYYVITLDDLYNLNILLRNYLMRSVSWNPGAKFLLLFHNIEERNQTEETAMQIFYELLNEAFVTKAALLYATSPTTYNLVAMRYYQEVDCRKLKTQVFGQCDNGQFSPTSMILKTFVYKLYNAVSAKNCSFSLCASVWAPFVEESCASGIEMKMVDFLKERLKFSVDTICTYENRGVLEPSGTYSGLLGKLNNRTCDFVIGGFYPDDEISLDFWVTDCYMEDSYTWFVKLAEDRPFWMALYNIFEDVTWLCFLAVLMVTWFFWYVYVNLLPESKNSKQISLIGLNNLGVFIMTSVYERPICHATRILFMALNLYAINVMAIFVSKLISVFKDPGLMHQIDELTEVVEAGIPFGGFEENHDWFENEDDQWIFDMYNNSLEFIPNTANLEQVKKGNKVILCSRLYILQHPVSDHIIGFPKNVFTSPIQMIMKPGFILRYEINLLIRRMRDFGIFEKIINDFIYNHSYLNRIAEMRPEFTERVIVLTIEHLRAPFILLCVGLGISFLVFMGEFIWWYGAKAKQSPPKKQLKKKHKPKKNHKQPSKRKAKNLNTKHHAKDNNEDVLLIPWTQLNSYYNNNNNKNIMRFTPPHRRNMYYVMNINENP